jgi:hypothetical protein
LGIPSNAERDEKGDEEQRGKHWRSWQMAKEGGGEKKREGKGRERKASEKGHDRARIGCLSEAHFFLHFAPAA